MDRFGADKTNQIFNGKSIKLKPGSLSNKYEKNLIAYF